MNCPNCGDCTIICFKGNGSMVRYECGNCEHVWRGRHPDTRTIRRTTEVGALASKETAIGAMPACPHCHTEHNTSLAPMSSLCIYRCLSCKHSWS